MKNRRARTTGVTAVGLAALELGPAPGAQPPTPVRNDVPRVGQQEVIMMRHAYLEDLEEGRYEAWHEASRSGVWPYFERLGARILSDFEGADQQGRQAGVRRATGARRRSGCDSPGSHQRAGA